MDEATFSGAVGLVLVVLKRRFKSEHCGRNQRASSNRQKPQLKPGHVSNEVIAHQVELRLVSLEERRSQGNWSALPSGD
jgi:hypothetical protein